MTLTLTVLARPPRAKEKMRGVCLFSRARWMTERSADAIDVATATTKGMASAARRVAGDIVRGFCFAFWLERRDGGVFPGLEKMSCTSCGFGVEKEEGFEGCGRGFASFVLRLLCAAAALPLFRSLRRSGGSIVWRSAWSGVRTIIR